MIYLSAQPDEYYFLWQLELLIYNFKCLDIDLDKIHILIGYDINKKLSEDSKLFVKKYKDVGIYCYPDTRKNKNYASSIRPHIISKHFESFPELSKETIFYHDSDIIFREPLNLELLTNDLLVYASNTYEYISRRHIINICGEAIFSRMCNIVGIDTSLVEKNDSDAGGAQYVLKNTSKNFWEKIESDCEKLFDFLTDAESRLNRYNLSNDRPFIQKWCTDMWVMWWNILLEGKMFKVHRELDFCWANSPISEWHRTKILHYTGNVSMGKYFFRKGDFILYSPFHEGFQEIGEDTCSFPLIKIIKDFSKDHLVKKKNLKDVSFLIPIKIDSEDRLKNLYATTAYIDKYFETQIFVFEVDHRQQVDVSRLPQGTRYIFEKTDNDRLFRTRINNEMIKIADTSIVALYDADVIIPLKQILQAVKMLRKGPFKIVSPYDGRFFEVDILLKEMFIKFQDDDFLKANRYKGGLASMRSYGGCIFIDKECYKKAGMENQNLTSWGPDDLERVKRMQILGNRTIRVQGCLYHLHHERKMDSGYQNQYEYENLMLTYLDISRMDEPQLKKHIKTWKWINYQKQENQ